MRAVGRLLRRVSNVEPKQRPGRLELHVPVRAGRFGDCGAHLRCRALRPPRRMSVDEVHAIERVSMTWCSGESATAPDANDLTAARTPIVPCTSGSDGPRVGSSRCQTTSEGSFR